MFNIFNRQPRAWRTPQFTIWTLYKELSEETHLLVAGETGSGKSVVINSIITTLLTQSPAKVRFYMIDPKRTELIDYAELPHVLRYAYRHADIISALQEVVTLMESRLDVMQRNRQKLFNGPQVYVIIDELADLLLTMKRQASPLLQRILQLGRAARITVIAGTQVVNASVIKTELRVNFTAIMGLRTATAAHSRLLVGRSGCETFPNPKKEHKAYGFYRHGCECELYNLPTYTEQQQADILNWWQSKQCSVIRRERKCRS